MSSLDLVKSVEEFLSATSNECYQPGGLPDITRSRLREQLKLEQEQSKHALNAHTYPNYNCEKCSNLLNHLQNMFDNPPQTISIVGKQLGSYHITTAFQAAVQEVISFVKGDSSNG